MTTFAAFTASLAALSVTGVTKSFSAPPASLASADLPASWPGLPSGEVEALTFASGGMWPDLTCDLVVAVEAVGQNTQSANYAATITIIDNLTSALKDASIGQSRISFSITANVQVQVADITYWAVIATIQGR